MKDNKSFGINEENMNKLLRAREILIKYAKAAFGHVGEIERTEDGRHGFISASCEVMTFGKADAPMLIELIGLCDIIDVVPGRDGSLNVAVQVNDVCES